MISIETETLITLPQAARRIPTHPHPATVHRWAMSGKLEWVWIGGRRYRSLEAIKRMFARDNGSVDSPPVSASFAERRRQIAEADREADELGLV
ncbi:DUF1580 domain-containing protein [Anatilimnocola floriformis]|uniref:DUF1580 domain-containing protein n=1 Tax=Anatilimnocola floriformis TaxID=2948575 RepID=UPI0020C33B43|nr:DUF1580 domain-containing protein [Anatilimnocola floriformis]